MATKISELTAIDVLTTSDVLTVVDVSTSTTNKCTVAQILALASGLTLPVELDTDDADAVIKIGPDPVGGTYPDIGIIRSEEQADGTDRVLIAMKDGAGDDIPILSHDWVRIAIGATWDQSDLSAGTTTRIAKVGIFADTHEVYADRQSFVDDRGAYYRYGDATLKTLSTTGVGPHAVGLTVPAALAGAGPYVIYLRALRAGDNALWIRYADGTVGQISATAGAATWGFDGTSFTGDAGAAIQLNATGVGPMYIVPSSAGISTNGSSGDILTSDGAGDFGTAITPAAGIATFLATPSSANLRTALTDETGTGVAVFANAPTLNSPVMVTPKISDSAGGQSYNFAVSNLAADRTVTLPLLTGNDEFVFAAHAVTLTNKTMSGASNTFSNIPITALTGSSADLRGALSDETGTGACVFADAPVPTGTWSWASGGAIGFTGGTAHATSGMIRVPYAATQTIIGARTSATSTVALLSSIAADNYQLGDATAFNMDLAGANTNVIASSTLTFYGGGSAGASLTGTTMNLKPGNVSALALFNTPNASFFSAAGSFGSGTAVIFIANRTAAPSSNPTGGGILYAESGALKWRGSSGTVTTIAPA